MNLNTRKQLFLTLEKKNFSPKHVAEVGVYLPETCNIIDYIERGVTTTLVEPDPASIQKIQAKFGDKPQVTLHPVAVYDFSGQLELVARAASTFVSQLEASPAIVNDGYQTNTHDQFTVNSVTFDQIDDGSIDLISIDTEGSEWFVLKHMTSRPAVISIETHGAAYTNPYAKEINDWMMHNGYQILYKDRSDSVFVQPNKIAITWQDRSRLLFKNAALNTRKYKKRLLKRIKRTLNNHD